MTTCRIFKIRHGDASNEIFCPIVSVTQFRSIKPSDQFGSRLDTRSIKGAAELGVYIEQATGNNWTSLVKVNLCLVRNSDPKIVAS